MDISVLGIGATGLAFALGYNFRRLGLRLEDQVRVAERQAALKAEQLEATVAASLDGIIVINADGYIIDFSASAERIFGHQKSEIIGRHMADIIVPERYRDAHNAGVARMRQTQKGKILGQRIEIEALRADGSEFMSELTISQSSGEAGDIFIAYIRDISERTAAKKSLIAAKEAAEAACEARARFLAMMSHEIRTPFNAVLGLLDILSETELTEEQLHLLKTAEQSSVALIRIINDVLDYARMTSGQATLLSHPFQARSVFDDVVQLFSSQARDKGLEFSLRCDAVPDDLFLEGDIGRIRQVLLNLVSNAIKFTDTGSVTLEVEVEPMSDEDCALTCRVRDTGIGIPDGVQAKLFDEFYMVDSSATRAFEGTGLGLAISKGLTEQMGGTLEFESVAGDGATFWMRLPLATTTASAATDRYDRRDYDMQDARILVAEDNGTNQMVIDRLLKNRCQSVTLVDNGLEVLDALDREDFDLILMDIFMPKMNGREATRLIRASNNAHMNVPIIALTAMGSFQDLDALLTDGIDQVVTKPFKKDDLLAAMGSLLETGRQRPTEPSLSPSSRVTKALEFGGFANELSAEDIPAFQLQLSRDLTSIRDAFDGAAAQKDWGSLKAPAHTLKGLAGTYAMNALAELAREVEAAAKANDASQCAAFTNTITDHLDDYIDALEGLFQRVQRAA